MGKKHDTFPGEQEEMPQRKPEPEIKQPADPKEPDTNTERPDNLPEELPEKPHQPGKTGQL